MVKAVKSESAFEGESGLARVSMMEGGNVRITMIETGNVYDLTKDDLPEYFPFRPKIEIPKVRVVYDGKNKKIAYANPSSGDHPVKFAFFNKEDEVPAPISRKGKKGSTFNSIDAFFEITDGYWKGARGVFYLSPDSVKKDEQGNIFVNAYGKYLNDWLDFLHAVGLDSVDIPYSENPFPDIQKRALEIGKKSNATFLDGKIEALADFFDFPEEVKSAETKTAPETKATPESNLLVDE